MNCLEIQEYLPDYLDNELPASLQQMVAEHLQSCLTCRNELEGYRKTITLLQLRAVPEPPPEYWDETWEKIRFGLKARVLPLAGQRLVSPSRWLWLKRFHSHRVAAVAAIFLLAVAALWWSWQSRQREFAETSRRSHILRETTRYVPSLEEDLPEEVRRQMELITVSRVAFGSIDPISKSAMFARMEVEGR